MPAFTGGTGVGYPVALTEVGLAIEATKGTLAAAPLYLFPIKAPKYKPDQAYLPDETLQGSMVQIYDEIQGMRYDTHGVDSYPYLDSFPLLTRCEFGSPDTKTSAPASTTLAASATAGSATISATATIASGSYISIGTGNTAETHLTSGVSGAGPFSVTLVYPLINNQPSGAAVTGLTKHQFSLLNNANAGQPPSASLWDYDGEEWRTMTACQLDELTIKGNATGLVSYTCSWFGNAASDNATPPATSFTTTETALPWSLVAAFGGTQVLTVEDWEFDFKRQVKPIPALTGTQEYFEYFAGTLLATGKVTFVEQSASPYLATYLNGTKEAIDFTLFDPEGNALNIHSSKSMFTTGEIDRSKEWVEVPVSVQMLPSSTDATAGGVSPCSITIANAVTTSY